VKYGIASLKKKSLIYNYNMYKYALKTFSVSFGKSWDEFITQPASHLAINCIIIPPPKKKKKNQRTKKKQKKYNL